MLTTSIKMHLSEHNFKTLLLFLHQKIEEYAENTTENLANGSSTVSIMYPPNGGLTEAEQKALEKLKLDADLKSALRKIIADNSAGVLFELLNIIDGTTDPDEELGNWTEIGFVDKTDDLVESDDFLHDEFLASYWDWIGIRPDKEWKLDNFD